nr:hypothetical protein [Tanacetum cinerariifolium]
RVIYPLRHVSSWRGCQWTCGTQSNDVALPRGLDLHANVAADVAAIWKPLTHPLTAVTTVDRWSGGVNDGATSLAAVQLDAATWRRLAGR